MLAALLHHAPDQSARLREGESDLPVAYLRRQSEFACLQECWFVAVAKATRHRADCA